MRGEYVPAPPDKQGGSKTNTNFRKNFDEIPGGSVLFIVGKISDVHNNSFPVYKSFLLFCTLIVSYQYLEVKNFFQRV